MKPNMSRILVETTVKTALKKIKTDPERGVRNLIDMALQCTNGRFQQKIFSTVQRMLQNEHSAYYHLIRNVVANTDTDHLFTFGMNLGYNACTIGAQKIRTNEQKMQCNIPWALVLQIDPKHFPDLQQTFHTIINDGETLGIYAWVLLIDGDPQPARTLAAHHPDSAFFLICEPETLHDDVLDKLADQLNLMLVMRYNEQAQRLCPHIQHRGLLYGVWYPYTETDLPAIASGTLFHHAQALQPLFTVLIPAPNCPATIQQQVHQIILDTRNQQTFCTLPLEMRGDTRMVDAIISEDTCSIYVDQKGDLYNLDAQTIHTPYNLFRQPLAHILARACAKQPI